VLLIKFLFQLLSGITVICTRLIISQRVKFFKSHISGLVFVMTVFNWCCDKHAALNTVLSVYMMTAELLFCRMHIATFVLP